MDIKAITQNPEVPPNLGIFIIKVHLAAYFIGFCLIASIPTLRDTESIIGNIFQAFWLVLLVLPPLVNLVLLSTSVFQSVSLGKQGYLLKSFAINGLYFILICFISFIGYVIIQAGGV
tara:strand:+ start:55 stop:408 length:354 start_codon:yes stop_codon:yes gene_type:complete